MTSLVVIKLRLIFLNKHFKNICDYLSYINVEINVGEHSIDNSLFLYPNLMDEINKHINS